MILKNFPASCPLLNYLGAKLITATSAQIVQFSFVGVAGGAEVFKKDIYPEIICQLFLVFADVFGGQLHLASHYVVSILDERGIEHDAKHVKCLQP